MKTSGFDSVSIKLREMMLYRRWPWHLFFWMGYISFRFWPYYITVKYYHSVFLEYMLLSEMFFIAATYVTLWLYRRFFHRKKYIAYFLFGVANWILYLCSRTAFQFYYLRNERAFQGSTFVDIFLNNIAFVIVGFLFITACKFFKDGYILQQFESERKAQQLVAEVNNLKSQIAPHFLFNTLNNLYGLAVDKSDKLPDLMLRLSDLLRHSLYETQRNHVSVSEEIRVLKSYVELERIRLEDDLKLEFDNSVPETTQYLIAPLVLIVFVENAFKHAKFVRSEPIIINIKTSLEGNLFTMKIENTYNREKDTTSNGIGLLNVKRRLDVLYPENQHELIISKNEYFQVTLKLKLAHSSL